jgi:hypothetical protein
MSGQSPIRRSTSPNRRALYLPRPPPQLPQTARQQVEPQVERAEGWLSSRVARLRRERDKFESKRNAAFTSRTSSATSRLEQLSQREEHERQAAAKARSLLEETLFHRRRAKLHSQEAHLERRLIASREGVAVLCEAELMPDPSATPRRLASGDRYGRLLQPLQQSDATAVREGLGRRLERHDEVLASRLTDRSLDLSSRASKREEQREDVLRRLQEQLEEAVQRQQATTRKTEMAVQRAANIQKRKRNPRRALALDRYFERLREKSRRSLFGTASADGEGDTAAAASAPRERVEWTGMGSPPADSEPAAAPSASPPSASS